MYYVAPIQRKRWQRSESLYICCYVRSVSCQEPCKMHATCKAILFHYILPLFFSFLSASGPGVHAPAKRFVWTASTWWFASFLWHNNSVLCYIWNRFLDHFESLLTHIVHGLKDGNLCASQVSKIWAFGIESQDIYFFSLPFTVGTYTPCILDVDESILRGQDAMPYTKMYGLKWANSYCSDG
jgi:hypothetical protein